VRSITFTPPRVAARRTFCARRDGDGDGDGDGDIHIHLSKSGTQLAHALDVSNPR